MVDWIKYMASSPEAAKSVPEYWQSGDLYSLFILGAQITAEVAVTYMGVAALFYLLFIGLRISYLRNRKIQKRKTPWVQVRREIFWSGVSFLVFGLVGLICVVAREMQWSREYQSVDEYGWAYLLFSVWLIFTVHDIWHYFWHRLLHEVPFLFRHVHRIHHTFRTPTPFSADAFHPLDALVNISFLPLIVFLIPVHSGVMHLYLMNVVVLNIVGHTGFEIMPKGLTRHKVFQWLNTPTAHDIHHARVHCNYGLYTNILDRALGTFEPSTFKVFEQVTERKAQTVESEEAFSRPESNAVPPVGVL